MIKDRARSGSGQAVSLPEAGKGASTVERYRGGERRPTVLPYIDRLGDRADGAKIVEIEPKDLITWGIGSAAALIAAVGVALQLRRDRNDRRRRQDDDDLKWRIDALAGYDEGEWKGLRLVYRAPDTQPCTIHEMAVLKPKGAEIALLEKRRNPESNALELGTRPAVSGRTIIAERSLTGYRPGRGPADIEDLFFHIRLPPSRQGRAQRSVAAVIRLTVSDKSRTRRRRQICITSDEITVDNTKNPSVM